MKDGQPQRSNARLFMQFMAFGGCAQTAPLGDALARAKISGVLYEDVNDPRGVGLLTFSEDPDFFLDRVRPILNGPGFSVLTQKQEFTMLGRTYAIGYEPDLTEILQNRPRRTVLNGRSGTRCGGAASSRSCQSRNSASFSPSTAPSACRSGPATTRTTSGWPATASTRTTTTSSSASSGRICIRCPRSSRR
jgi:hypothetical protein